MAGVKQKLDMLDEDILILILSNLAVPDLLSLRRACQRLHKITHLRIVWRNACVHNILQRGYPFPDNLPLDTLTSADIERYTRLAHRLATKWLSLSLHSQRSASPSHSGQQVDWLPLSKDIQFNTTSSTEITAVRFLPGRKERYLLAVSKGIWSTLSLWQIEEPGCMQTRVARRRIPKERASWSLKGALFTSFAVNTDVTSEAVIAVSVYAEGQYSMVILTLEGLEVEGSSASRVAGEETTDGIKFKVISTVDTNLEPMELAGDIIALSNKFSETVLFNWRTGKTGLLQHEPEQGVFKHDPCVQVVFAHCSVLVIRARSLHLFPQPTLVDLDDVTPIRSIAQHSFGWVDGISATVQARTVDEANSNSLANRPIMILCRAPNHDPWSGNMCTFDLYTLSPNPAFTPPTDDDTSLHEAPYIFPPRLKSQASSRRGPLRCLDIALGKYGTAVWIHPRDSASHGLISANTHLQEIPLHTTAWSDERLVAAVFAGSLRGALESDGIRAGHDEGCVEASQSAAGGNQGLEVEVAAVKTIARKEAGSWAALDYDEAMGRIALGTGFGGLMVLEI